MPSAERRAERDDSNTSDSQHSSPASAETSAARRRLSAISSIRCVVRFTSERRADHTDNQLRSEQGVATLHGSHGKGAKRRWRSCSLDVMSLLFGVSDCSLLSNRIGLFFFAWSMPMAAIRSSRSRTALRSLCSSFLPPFRVRLSFLCVRCSLLGVRRVAASPLSPCRFSPCCLSVTMAIGAGVSLAWPCARRAASRGPHGARRCATVDDSLDDHSTAGTGGDGSRRQHNNNDPQRAQRGGGSDRRGTRGAQTIVADDQMGTRQLNSIRGRSARHEKRRREQQRLKRSAR